MTPPDGSDTGAAAALGGGPAGRGAPVVGECRLTTRDGYDLWARESGDPAGPPVLLVMGAASSSAVWPAELLRRLGREHRVLVWDRRDTGRSGRSAGRAPYALTDLAADAVAVLDAFDVRDAHVVGMSMGGLLTQLLLLDHPGRLRSATLLCTGPLAGADTGGRTAPGPSADLLALWARLGEPRDEAAEVEFRLTHWRLLNGSGTPFEEREFRELEERVLAHGGELDASSATAHARAGTDGLERGAELRAVTVPVLVVDAPHDPAHPLRTPSCSSGPRAPWAPPRGWWCPAWATPCPEPSWARSPTPSRRTRTPSSGSVTGADPDAAQRTDPTPSCSSSGREVPMNRRGCTRSAHPR